MRLRTRPPLQSNRPSSRWPARVFPASPSFRLLMPAPPAVPSSPSPHLQQSSSKLPAASTLKPKSPRPSRSCKRPPRAPRSSARFWTQRGLPTRSATRYSRRRRPSSAIFWLSRRTTRRVSHSLSSSSLATRLSSGGCRLDTSLTGYVLGLCF